MADIVIAGGVVVTMDKTRRVIEDGAVAITGDRIVAVGPTAEVTAAHRAKRTIDARRKAVMPGMIDCHAHAGHGLVKTMGGGDGEAWSEACRAIYTTASPPEFWAAEAKLSALERLKCGVTTGVSLLGGGDSVMRVDEPAHGEAHCDGVDAVGIRAFVAVGPCRPPFPWTYARWDGAARKDYAVSFERQYQTCETLLNRRHRKGTGRIHICTLMPVHHPAEDGGGEMLATVKEQAREIRALGKRHGARFHQDGHRQGSIAAAHEVFDLLGPDAFLSHCVDLDAADIAAAKATDTRIVHNPSAHMSIRGRCPVPELIDAGVTVALGSDGTAPDRSYDMFRHMFQAMHYHRRHFRDSKILPPGKALEMTTIDSARALGLEAEIGSLEAGKKADVILVDLFKPHLYPFNMPLYRLVCFANGADVDTAICDGRILMEGRRVSSIDESAVLEEAQRETDAMLARSGLGHMLATPENFWGRSHY